MNRIRAISFDCYGTLIDWESGIRDASEKYILKGNTACSPEEVLEKFAQHESRLEAEVPVIPYSDILREIAVLLGKDLEVSVTTEDASGFAESIGEWPLFPDVIPTLQELEQNHTTAILSNVDRISFAHTLPKFENLINLACIAEEIGAYKPSLDAFSALEASLMERGIHKTEILHVAQSLYHDHEPAKKHGLVTCWVDRRYDQDGWGAVPAPAGDVQPDFSITNLAELPGLLAKAG